MPKAHCPLPLAIDTALSSVQPVISGINVQAEERNMANIPMLT